MTTAEQTMTDAREGAAEVLAAFDAKVREVAAANDWTLVKAADVMLRYLRDTDPETTAAIATSALVSH